MTRILLVFLAAAAIAGCSSSTAPISNGGSGGGLVLVPHALDFGSVPSGQTKDTTIGLFDEGIDTATITSNGVSSGAVRDTNFSHPLTLGPDGSRTIHIEFTPSSQTASGTDTLYYTSGGIPYNAVLSINSSPTGGGSTGGGSGGVYAPTVIDFGSLPIGQMHDTSIVLVNTGTASITMLSSAVNSSEAQDTNFSTPLTINAGGYIMVHLQFDPAQAGFRTAVDSLHYLAGGSLHSLGITMIANGVSTVTSPGAGSTFTYAVDTNGVLIGTTTETIISNTLTYQHHSSPI